MTQTTTPFASIDTLDLFPLYTRPSWKAQFGVDAPPFDPARGPKPWFDPAQTNADPKSIVGYQRFDMSIGQFVAFSMTASEAATLNLTGSYPYPSYTVAPTTAHESVLGFATQLAINAAWLATRADADALVTEAGADTGQAFVVSEQTPASPFAYVYPSDESRRMWRIVSPQGVSGFVGDLLASRNANGVGAPGKWAIAGNTLQWGPGDFSGQPTPATPAQAPAPVRALLPNEAIASSGSPFGGYVVKRTDVTAPNAPFGDADRAVLSRIDANLSALRRALNF